MLEALKKRVLEQNLALVRHGLVVLTWGNVSARDPETGWILIKPSGVPYDRMREQDIVVVDTDGNIVEGLLRPSSDLPTHLYLYRTYASLGGIVHTHSTYATAFAQSGRAIPAYGTTHADSFFGDVPCARALTDEEIANEYEWNTGKVIAEAITDANAIPAMLVKSHGVFTWGPTPEKAVENAVTVEEVAKMALLTEQLNPGVSPIKQTLLDKHYLRKHGKNAYYGQT